MIFGALIWLASYPKSGNTWMRVILGALLFGRERAGAADINALEITDHAGNRGLVEAVSACPSSELLADELERLRPAGFRFLAAHRSGLSVVKVHDAYRIGQRSASPFPADVPAQAIYIVRNPLDVSVSFAAHLGVSLDEVIAIMADDFVLGAEGSGLGPQLPQHLGSWSDHVRSWTGQDDIPVYVVRYEDMVRDVEAELERIARLLELPATADDVSAAAAAGAFDRLQLAESQAEFREKPASLKGRFFRSGRAGGWREVLTNGQVDRLTELHSDMMLRFGYLDDL